MLWILLILVLCFLLRTRRRRFPVSFLDSDTVLEFSVYSC